MSPVPLQVLSKFLADFHLGGKLRLQLGEGLLMARQILALALNDRRLLSGLLRPLRALVRKGRLVLAQVLGRIGQPFLMAREVLFEAMDDFFQALDLGLPGVLLTVEGDHLKPHGKQGLGCPLGSPRPIEQAFDGWFAAVPQ